MTGATDHHIVYRWAVMIMLGVSVLPLLIGWSREAGLVTGEASRFLKASSAVFHEVVLVGLLLWKRSMALLVYFLISLTGLFFLSSSSPVLVVYLLMIFLLPCFFGSDGCILEAWTAPSVP